jgi:TolB-like protein/Flp pilus assembly protein TadD
MLADHERADDPVRRFQFGAFAADLRTGQLTKTGRRVRLQEQPFRLLAVLLARAGELVTREELHAALWPQTTVDFDHGLNKAISKIRQALGDSADRPRFIGTVARRGYRFLTEVTTVREVPDWRSQPINSLAVLPLLNLSGDTSQDYFADGMTEVLIADLGQIRALHVISRTSAMAYKGSRKPLPEIGRELGVRAVVEGSVMRFGDQVRITAQLIEVPADRHIWAHSYTEELGNALVLQSRVARDIAQRVEAALTFPEQLALAKPRAVKPEAFEDYLKGRYFWNKRTSDGLRAAIACFERAIERDPSFAAAHSGLADAYALAGDWEYGVLAPRKAFIKAQAEAAKALALDDGLAEAHTSLAFALDLYGWDWEAARREYVRAIELNPGYATAHLWYAWHLMIMGQISEGISELRKAESLDPLSAIIGAELAEALCVARRYDESVAQSRKTLEIDPNFAVTHYGLGKALMQKHMHDAAISAFRRAIDLGGQSVAFASDLAYALAASGRTTEAVQIASDLQAQHKRNPSADANIALIFVGLGDNDQAMSWLGRAYRARFHPAILLRPAWDALRPDKRFQRLLRRIGLPEYSQR